MIVALVGAHGVGKTTLGQRLADRLGIPFDGEIGAILAADPTWRPADGTADACQPVFDAEVFRRELARDEEHAASKWRVVESWHPVNLAYANRRSPEVARAWWPTIRRSVEARRALVVPLLAPPEVLEARAWEHGDRAFFQEVGFEAVLWGAHLGCAFTPAVWTHRTPPEHLVEALVPLLEHAWTPSY